MVGFEIRDEREPGHFWADNEVYDHYGSRIGPTGLAIYMGLCRYSKAGIAWPSIRRLANDLGIKSEQTVRKALAVLKEVELIRIEERPADPEAKRGTQTHRFYILKVEKDKREVKAYQGEGANNVPPPALDAPGGGNLSHPNKTYMNKTQRTSGGDARANGTAAADGPLRTLISCGLTPAQAKRATDKQVFAPDLLDRVVAWSEKMRAANKNPGRILCGYTDVGALPDDLPAAAASTEPVEQITWDEVNGRPIVSESLRRQLEAEARKPRAYHG